MKLSKVYARFYKSFNFDHHRKAHPGATRREWEKAGQNWYPYVEIPIDERITTIVGANESGKSHLLGAIKKGITGEGFRHQDLCRYCDFFNVERGNEFWPHIGIAWSAVTPEEVAKIRAQVGLAPERFDAFLMFRRGPDKLDLYFPKPGGTYKVVELSDSEAHSFGQTFLPQVFEINAKIALPDALPTSELVEAQGGHARDRRARQRSLGIVDILRRAFSKDENSFVQKLGAVAPELSPILAEIDESPSITEDRKKSYELARRLLLQLANIDPARLAELATFIDAGENGHATALVDSINRQLEKKLNFPKYWVQDSDFQLRVTALESELVFTIRDRTGTHYTFAERSEGLKYFLSYFIQSQTHERDSTRSEVLLMDEPDAYLSAEAQQDLLKIFRSFAEPEDATPPVQVIYVTHSPFLLDKNRAERIRVLQKGKGPDGTRVINNASQNHYEPLRSSFGAYVGETAFIGACNLLVEGAADQILLAGVSRVVQRRGAAAESDYLDLNRLVLVPCGSANHVPYMVYLVRGRDSEAPAIIVLLDSDPSGDKAAAKIRMDDQPSLRLVKREYVMQFAEFDITPDAAHAQHEPEDMLPLQLAVAAANVYFKEVADFKGGEAIVLRADDVAGFLSPTKGIYDALSAAAKAVDSHIDKVGLARAVVALCEDEHGEAGLDEHVVVFLERAKKLFRSLNRQRRSADEDRLRHRIKAMVEQQRKMFLQDHPDATTCEQGTFLFERIRGGLDNSLDGKAIRNEMLAISADFHLDVDPAAKISNYDLFKTRLSVLKDAFTIRRAIEVEREPSAPDTKEKTPKRRPAGARQVQRKKGISPGLKAR